MLALGLVGTALALSPAVARAGAVPARGSAPEKSAPRAALGFVENKGQWANGIKFMGDGQGVTMWLKSASVVLDYARPKESRSHYAGHAVEMRFVGSKGGALSGAARNGTSEYLYAHKSSVGGKFGRVQNSSVYPGIDFVSYYDGESPRYDFIVAPGADPSAIRLGFDGAKSIRVVDADTLALGTAFGEQKIDGLFAYQKVGATRKSVPVRFAKNANGEVIFRVGAYDKSKPLVIDPLVYGTYFGANRGFDEVRGIGSDIRGGTYVTGYTVSREFPRNQGPYGFDIKGGRDAFLSKLQGDAYKNDYSVYIGGSGNDQADFISVDASGNVFVMGVTDSSDFPGRTAPNVGAGRRWILRFAPNPGTVLTPFRDNNGNGRVTAEEGETGPENSVVRFFGNDVNGFDGIDFLAGFAIPRPEDAATTNITRIVTGGTSRFGTQIAGVGTRNGDLGSGEISTAFYVEFNYNKADASFSINSNNSGYVVARDAGIDLTGVTVDNLGNTYLNGSVISATSSNTATGSFPRFDTTDNVYPDGRLQRASDLYVRKLDPTGRRVYSALLGGSADEFSVGTLPTRNLDLANSNPDGPNPFFTPIVEHRGPTIAADDNGNAYVVGSTVSIDFPRSRGEEFNVSRANIALTKISTGGNEIVYSRNMGIGGVAAVAGLSVDPRGVAYLTGLVGRTNVFNDEVGNPPTPNAAADNIGAIPTTADAIRPEYTSTDNPQLSTTDGFFLAVNGDGSGLVQGTYVGGILDDVCYAPYTDVFGDTFVYGWTETIRDYALIANTEGARPTRYRTEVSDATSMDAFITPGAFKGAAENRSNGLPQFETNVAYGVGKSNNGTPAPLGKRALTDVPFVFNNEANPLPDPQTDPPTPQTYKYTFAPYFSSGGISYVRDGYILRYRLSLPLLSSLTLDPSSIPGGDASGNGTPASTLATLSLSTAAPAGGAAITLSLDNGTIASFNPSSSVTSITVTIPEGSLSTQFRVYSLPVTDVQNVSITADYAGNIRVASLAIRPWLQSLSVSTNTVIGGAGETGPPSTYPTGTVSLAAPAQGATTVVLTGSSNNVRFVNAAGQITTTGTVVVPDGQQTATFAYYAQPTDTIVTAQVRASLLGVTRAQNITIIPALLNRIIFNPNSIAGGSTTNGTVFLDGRAASERLIKVTVLSVATGSGYKLGGSSVNNPFETIITIPENGNSANFSLTTGFESSNVTRRVSAVQVRKNQNGTYTETGPTVTGSLLVTAQGIASVSVAPSPIESGANAVVTVTLSAPAPDGGVIATVATATTPYGSLFPLNTTFTFAKGELSKTFTVKTGANTTNAAVTLTVNAYRGSPTNGSLKSGKVTVNPLTFTTSTPAAVFGGSPSTITITLPRAQSRAIRFNVTVPNKPDGTPDTSITVTQPAPIAPGSLTTTFRITTTEVAVNTTKTVRVQMVNDLGVGTQQAFKPVNITVRAVQIASLTVNPATVRSGFTTTLTVTLDGVVSRDTTLALTYSNGGLISFPPVVIKAGTSSAKVISRPAAVVTRTLATTISASLGGKTVSTTLTVQPVQVLSLSLNPSTIRSGATTSLTVRLDGPAATDTTIALAYSNGTLIGFPPVVIKAGTSSVVVTSRPAARVARTLSTSISATLGGNTASTTLTVQR